MEELERRSRGWTTAAGVAAIIAGMVAIVVPAVASVAVDVFIGWMLIVAGSFTFASALGAREMGQRLLRGLLALVTFAAGVYLLVAPLSGTFTLTVMLAMWFVAVGVARLVGGLVDLGGTGAGWLIASGALTLALGLLIALELPSSADWAIGLVVGVDFLFSGTTLLALAGSPGALAADGRGERGMPTGGAPA